MERQERATIGNMQGSFADTKQYCCEAERLHRESFVLCEHGGLPALSL